MAIKTSATVVSKQEVIVSEQGKNIINEQNAVVDLSKGAVDNTREAFDLTPVRNSYIAEIKESGRIDELTSLIDISNTNTIIEFGKKPALEMSKVADQVMSKYDMSTIQSTSSLVQSLLDVMKKIDIGEVNEVEKPVKKSFFSRFKESAEQRLNRLVDKYKGIGYEMENICNQLTVYEQQIKDSNNDIARMYEQAKVNYRELTAYILAGEQAIEEIKEYRDSQQKQLEDTGNLDINFDIQNTNQALALMEQRVADLKSAESVALQSVPTFKIQEMTNANLARKVNSAFITTVPAFKTALVNSVIAKQQAIQMQGLMALDDATSALIRGNADNAVEQLRRSQQLASTSAIKADDVEYAWNKIMDGIQQYRELEEQYSNIRKEEVLRIERVNTRYLENIGNGSSI